MNLLTRVIEYMAMKIPVVASPVGFINDLITDGINGFLATSSNEWIKKISLLISDAQLRLKMGERGREIIENKYNTSIVATKFHKIISIE